MLIRNNSMRTLLLAGTCLAALATGPALAADTVITSGTTSSTPILVTGSDTLTVQGNATATNGPAGFGPVIWSGNATGTGIVVTNNGTLSNTKTGPAAPIVAGGNTYNTAGFTTVTATNTFTGNFAFTNNGLVTSVQGPTVFLAPAAGNITFTNNGVIMPSGGYTKNGVGQGQLNNVAIAFGSGTNVLTNTAAGNIAGDVILGSGTNTVNIQAGSLITGGIYGQASGTNTINLTGPGAGNAYGRSTAGFQGWNNINTLNVISGNWTLTGGGYYENLNIASGAVFNICDLSAAAVGQCSNRLNGTPNDGGIGPLAGSTLNVNLNGLMILQSSDGRVYYDPTAVGEFKATGTGRLLIQNTQGTGGYVGPNSNLSGFAGTTTVDGGAFILGTTIGGDVVINPKGTLQIGSGGNLRNINGQIVDNGRVGNVLGNIVDNGTLVINRLDDFTYAGNLSGSGNIIKLQSNTVTLSGQYTYTGKTQVRGGAIVLASTAKFSTASALDVSGGSINLNGTSQNVAGLSSADGNSGQLNVGGGTLTVTQSDNSSFNGTLSGAGALNKAGSGSLILNGNNAGYIGTTTISGGLLEVGDANNPRAVLGGSVDVVAGGILGGHGSIAGSVSNAGRLAPGGSIGTLNVTGSYAFASGSILEQEVAANGDTDLTQAGGAVTIATNVVAQVQPTDPVSSYAPLTTYTIITGAGGVSGTFSDVTSSVSGLTPVLNYSSNAVTLTLVRNNYNLGLVGGTPNQTAVAGALSSGPGGALFGRVAVNGAAAAPQALNALSGEAHATVSSAILENGGFLADAIAARSVSTKTYNVWAQGNGRWSQFNGTGNTAAASSNFFGFAGGADMTVKLFNAATQIGVAGGYSRDRIGIADRASNGRVSSTYLGGYIDLSDGPWSALVSISYAWHNIGAARTVSFTGVNQTAVSDYNGRSLGLSGELRHRMERGDLWIEPLARIQWSRLETYGFAEAGGSAELRSTASSRAVGFATLGVDLGKGFTTSSGSITPHAMLGWERGFGNLAASTPLAFAATGTNFSVLGAPLNQDSFRTEAGLNFGLGETVTLNVGYVGRHGGRVTQHGLQGGLKVSF